MAKITKIATQKRAGRYNLELDGRFAFGISENVLAKFGLMKGRELNKEEIERIKKADLVDQGLKVALNYLSPALRTQKQVEDRLKSKDIKEEVIDQVIDRLVDQQLVDDATYAKAYVNTKQVFSPKGPRAIAMDLKKAGVSENLIEDALTEYSEEDQLEVATKLAEKIARTHKRDSTRIRQQKTAQSLAQKGFSFDIASQAINGINIASNEEDERENAKKEAEKAIRRQRTGTPKERFYKVKSKLYAKGFDGETIEWALKQFDFGLD
ncbi:recombination regulator RecX [Fructobacillus sp. M1-13]|uniref:Regulatory protein RecX n=1 Tax=Fructobacillus papyriferae TaxID=2713171 RepID=A0ABS5QP32_9LACO|nr:recombination regulator RecX [Fructobacillus papyriferae]MBS9334914.1 recombination regulator RecX [Fructobacillus papyriferae]MCD2159602.1 recombination regulator RecX [Fructobacillus papyriferae]